MSSGLFALVVVTAVGCGLVGGFFFAFSNTVMKSLGLVPPPQGISAMQTINVTVINPLFMTALFGTAVACIAVGIASVVAWDQPYALHLLGGSLLYLIGNIVTTIACNVPRNDRLAELDPDSEEAADYWARYLVEWTAWNHVRTVSGLAASVLLAGSIYVS